MAERKRRSSGKKVNIRQWANKMSTFWRRQEETTLPPPPPRDTAALHRELRSKVHSEPSNEGTATVPTRWSVNMGYDEVFQHNSLAEMCSRSEPEMFQRQQEKIHVLKEPMADSTLYDAVKQQDWTRALRIVRMNPNGAKYCHARGGLFPLHLACSIGSSPSSLIQALLEAHPPAVNVKTVSKCRDTPLHIQCRNSQVTSMKVKILLKYGSVRIRNRFGHTPLHTACESNATIDVLRHLIVKDASLLDVHDQEKRPPLTVLWESFLQSIPGHLAVASILDGDFSHRSESFQRFWDKVQLLLSRAKVPQVPLGHAMIQQAVPVKMLQVALQLEPCLADLRDPGGNSMVHKMLICGYPFDSWVFVQSACKQAINTANVDNNSVLALAIKHDMAEYILPILSVAPGLLVRRDKQTGLYPFQLAASMDCTSEIVFALLLTQPEVIKY